MQHIDKNLVKDYLLALQDSICDALQAEDGAEWLVDLECSDDSASFLSLVALSVNSREELVVVCSACRFQIVTAPSRHDG